MFLLKVISFIMIILLSGGCTKTDVNTLIKKNYYGDIKHLDRYSRVVQGEDFDTLSIQTKSSYFGVGLTLIRYKKAFFILDIAKNSPSQKVGLKPADQILKIDNKDISKYDIKQIYKYINTKDKIKLTIKREKRIFDIFLHKQIIKKTNLSIKKINTNTLYIKINSFSKDLAQQIKNIILKNHCKNIIFDLRDNRGGIFEESIKLSDMFYDKGVIVIQKSKDSEKKYFFHKETVFKDKNLVILVDNYTASASEIFAGTLQKHKRAILIGEKTFGKATIQKLYYLEDKKLLKLTVAHYFLPSYKNIEKTGLTPDVKIRKKYIKNLNYLIKKAKKYLNN